MLWVKDGREMKLGLLQKYFCLVLVFDVLYQILCN